MEWKEEPWGGGEGPREKRLSLLPIESMIISSVVRPRRDHRLVRGEGAILEVKSLR